MNGGNLFALAYHSRTSINTKFLVDLPRIADEGFNEFLYFFEGAFVKVDRNLTQRTVNKARIHVLRLLNVINFKISRKTGKFI